MLDLVAEYLKELNIPHLRFQGDMSRSERDQAVKNFNKSPKYKVRKQRVPDSRFVFHLTSLP